MKRTPFKSSKPLKRGTWNRNPASTMPSEASKRLPVKSLTRKRGTTLKRGKKLRVKGHSEVNDLKDEIQRLVREIVMLRDGGCILKNLLAPHCNGYAKDGHLILQADHLISRGNAATYADTRLIVCLCKGHHGWKSVGSNLRKGEYDDIVKQLLPESRVRLWEACERDKSRVTHKTAYDWKIHIVALKQELSALKGSN